MIKCLHDSKGHGLVEVLPPPGPGGHEELEVDDGGVERVDEEVPEVEVGRGRVIQDGPVEGRDEGGAGRGGVGHHPDHLGQGTGSVPVSKKKNTFTSGKPDEAPPQIKHPAW